MVLRIHHGLPRHLPGSIPAPLPTLAIRRLGGFLHERGLYRRSHPGMRRQPQPIIGEITILSRRLVPEIRTAVPNRPERTEKLIHVISPHDDPSRPFTRMLTQAFIHRLNSLLNQLPAQFTQFPCQSLFESLVGARRDSLINYLKYTQESQPYILN